MNRWREVTGEALRAFVRGKTVRDIDDSAVETVTHFTDGSAARVTPVDGTVYSEESADSATVCWEVRDP